MKRTLFLLTLCVSSIFVNGQSFNGFALYNAQGSNTTYLIDENQNIAHTWNMSTECNYTVALKENGNLVRGTKYDPITFETPAPPASGGRVEELDPDGNIIWEYIYADNDHLSHHDLTLVGDNVLLTAYEKKTSSELNAAGHNSNNEKWPTHFIELQDDGDGGANIVWEWHLWDHMCQNVDLNDSNYVSNISDHPELIDINMLSSNSEDWFHVNGVDYNEDLDQIVFSSRKASEIYIIDHSTSTEEAASHSGGNSGMGGDILYRWGNPSNYGMTGNQVIVSAVHDARWITNDGRPNGGFLQIFNNCGAGCTGQGPSSVANSTIDGIETPWDDSTNTYLRTQGQAFTPISYSTRYECAYSSSGQSASDRMSNGNIFVNASNPSGVMYEVDAVTEQIIWGPYQAGSPKGFRYECDYPGIIALESYMYPNGNITTTCFTAASIDDESNNLVVYPNPTLDYLNINFQGKKEIYNILGIKVLSTTNNKIDLRELVSGLYTVRIAERSMRFIKK